MEVTGTVTLVGEKRDEDGWEHREWAVTLRCDGRSMKTKFMTGMALGEPTIGEVLRSLVDDARSVDNACDFEEWASDFGLDSDSRRAERMYTLTEKQSARLRRLLGADAYDAALDSDEDR